MKKTLSVTALCLVLVILISISFCKTERNLSDNLLRMHIIANSDSKADQQTKLKVRDSILNEMGKELSSFPTASYAKVNVSKKLDKIKTIAQNTLIQEGIKEDVKVSLENTYFPRKSYHDITLPKGNYDALRVEIGNAKGQNWWCVMFPPLCFADCATGEIKEDDKEKLKSNLPKSEAELITSDKNSIKVKFKLYELWQDGKEIINSIFN